MTNHIHCPECGRLRRRVAVRLNLITLESGRQLCRDCGWKSEVPKPKARFPWRIAGVFLGLILIGAGASALTQQRQDAKICSRREREKTLEYINPQIEKIEEAIAKVEGMPVWLRAYQLRAIARQGNEVLASDLPDCAKFLKTSFAMKAEKNAYAHVGNATNRELAEAKASNKLFGIVYQRIHSGEPADYETVKEYLEVEGDAQHISN